MTFLVLIGMCVGIAVGAALVIGVVGIAAFLRNRGPI